MNQVMRTGRPQKRAASLDPIGSTGDIYMMLVYIHNNLETSKRDNQKIDGNARCPKTNIIRLADVELKNGNIEQQLNERRFHIKTNSQRQDDRIEGLGIA